MKIKMKDDHTKIIKNSRVGNIMILNDPCLTYATVLVLWRVGSIYEKKNEHGMSHFIEHMLFKGTPKRPISRDITNDIYNIGGNINAYTSNEFTGYYVTIPNDKIDVGLDVLSDMLNNSLLRKEDIEDEKKVVIQENKKYNSSPLSYLNENLQETIYKNTPLAYDVGGFNKDIENFKYSQVMKYLKKHYQKKNRLICISGNIGRSERINKRIEKMVEKYFDKPSIFDQNEKKDLKRVKRIGKIVKTKVIKIKRSHDVVIRKQLDRFEGLSQAYITLAFPAYSKNDDRKYGLTIIGNILAGNMSSRLFMRLREKHGLVYSVHYSFNMYKDSGYISISAGTDNEVEKIQKVVEEIYEELRDIVNGGITEEEIDKTKRYLIDSFKMDDNSGIIFNHGEEYLIQNKYTTREEICRKYEKVTKRDIDQIVGEIFKWKKQYLVVLTDKKCKFLKKKKKEF